FQAEDGIRDRNVTGVQTCALPICGGSRWCCQRCCSGRCGDREAGTRHYAGPDYRGYCSVHAAPRYRAWCGKTTYRAPVRRWFHCGHAYTHGGFPARRFPWGYGYCPNNTVGRSDVRPGAWGSYPIAVQGGRQTGCAWGYFNRDYFGCLAGGLAAIRLNPSTHLENTLAFISQGYFCLSIETDTSCRQHQA